MRLDTVKSWSSGRNPASAGAIAELRALRAPERAGEGLARSWLMKSQSRRTRSQKSDADEALVSRRSIGAALNHRRRPGFQVFDGRADWLKKLRLRQPPMPYMIGGVILRAVSRPSPSRCWLRQVMGPIDPIVVQRVPRSRFRTPIQPAHGFEIFPSCPWQVCVLHVHNQYAFMVPDPALDHRRFRGCWADSEGEPSPRPHLIIAKALDPCALPFE